MINARMLGVVSFSNGCVASPSMCVCVTVAQYPWYFHTVDMWPIHSMR